LAGAGAVGSITRVRGTNLDKVFWPAEGYTKGDLVRYYEAIAPTMLPYLRDRPIVLTRYPDGIAGKSFFQKDAPEFARPWVRTERVRSRDTGRDIEYFVVDHAEALRYVANLGTIPIHAWSARVPSLERPDWLVLDLDPAIVLARNAARSRHVDEAVIRSQLERVRATAREGVLAGEGCTTVWLGRTPEAVDGALIRRVPATNADADPAASQALSPIPPPRPR